ncbi:HTH_Tnp_Tc3_2 domain-containing protein [Trichonephila clavipes]|uniref:HTH_Tnp_Tc3_2 domain-containing protein n=1 Tax=Trichonephila clavipes TaxID=2585209 RepID=A0A8X6T6R3_TRICX|nr:HTH_Tnp_Tc3_2 domain-containing protein [Trichonephila clavipes]
MQRDCALRITGRGRLTSFSAEYKTCYQSLFPCAESLTNEELRYTCHYVVFEDNMSSCRSMKGGESWVVWNLGVQLGGPRQTIRRKDRRVVRNARLQPTALSSTIKAQIAPSLGTPKSSGNIRRRLAERHLGSPHTLHVLPMTPTHRRLRLEWCHARGNWTVAEWYQFVFSNKSIINLSSDDNRVRVSTPRSERLNLPLF